MAKMLSSSLKVTVLTIISVILVFSDDFSTIPSDDTSIHEAEIFNYSVEALQAFMFTKAKKSALAVKEARKSLDSRIDEFEITKEKLGLKVENFKNTMEMAGEILTFWIMDLRNRIRSIQSNLMWDGMARLVAFQALLSPPGDDVAQNVVFNTSGPIIFPVITINEAGAYDKDTGVMTAPADGIYYLATRVKAEYRKGANSFDIYHNGNLVAKAETSGLRQEHDGAVTVTMVQMRQGDTAEVRTTLRDTGSLYTGTQTWFMGFLLNYRRKAAVARPRG